LLGAPFPVGFNHFPLTLYSTACGEASSFRLLNFQKKKSKSAQVCLQENASGHRLAKHGDDRHDLLPMPQMSLSQAKLDRGQELEEYLRPCDFVEIL